jgi:hypothetical protein
MSQAVIYKGKKPLLSCCCLHFCLPLPITRLSSVSLRGCFHALAFAPADFAVVLAAVAAGTGCFMGFVLGGCT